MACSLFGISNDVAMQMVGVGFIIGVIQDSVETALNSAGDVEFAATAEYHQWLKQGKPLPDFLRKYYAKQNGWGREAPAIFLYKLNKLSPRPLLSAER